MRFGVDVHRVAAQEGDQVSPTSVARSTASDGGVETAASTGMSAIAAVYASSNHVRPDTQAGQ
jgi:hypothetical protein